MSFRSWVTVITLILLVGVVYFGRHEIYQAWKLLGNVNLWILAMLIPVQFFSYYATGSIIFSYLRSKGNLKDTSHWTMTRMALELNFVNHIIPSGGAAGFSYLGWVLNRHGVSAGRATMAQLVRFSLSFIAFLALLAVAVVILFLDHRISPIIIMISVGLALVAIIAATLLLFVVGNNARLKKFSGWLTRFINGFMSIVTRGKNKQAVKFEVLEGFFEELHHDYLALRHEKKILVRPFIWAFAMNLADVALIAIAFLALGYEANPAILFVAFGVSSVASIVSVTPGGAGVYEAIMIAFLASAGVPADIAIAGTLLARVSLLLGTILFGYFFYQLTIVKYGKRPTNG
ncbi:hypothetical protein BH10PAT4_BH10PAT4_5430 [soil metagenome]